MIILDLETNGLLDTLTKIHCAVLYDTETEQFTIFTPDNIHKLCEFLNTCDNLSCHNGIGFDLKVLKKLYDYEYDGEYRDTLLMSRILWPDLENAKYIDEKGKERSVKNPHSVESWGVRFGIKKPEHEDWSVFTPEMLHRCKEDVKIQAKLWEHIQKHVDTLNMNDKRVDLERVFRLEHKVWQIIERQADYGWAFNLELAYKYIDELVCKIKEIDNVLLPSLPIRVVRPTEVVTKMYTNTGQITANARKWIEQNKLKGDACGDFSKVQFEMMNLNSDTQVKDYLLSNGWTPKEWNVKKDKHNKPIRVNNKLVRTSPKMPKTAEEWDEVANTIDNNNIKLLAERNKASHRLSQIQGFIENTRQDHRIEAQANTCSTNTARMTHRIVVNVPKAKESVYYGKQMRSLFVASKGKVLVGADASALEARIEAHYIYPFDKASALELIEGDIHTRNMEIFKCDRDRAKNGKYAIGYGCAAPKLATTIGCSVKQAEIILEGYWQGNPGLKKLKTLLEQAYDKYGYILSIDKRPLSVRYKHALINTLFQSAGSIAMKIALCILHTRLKSEWQAEYLGNFHDEIQMECLPKYSEELGRTMVQSIRDAGKYLKLNVELDGEYKVGKSWDLTH